MYEFHVHELHAILVLESKYITSLNKHNVKMCILYKEPFLRISWKFVAFSSESIEDDEDKF